MLIDWFTVIAQVINFLILVWLLKRFLYRPILEAIDAREKRIARELSDAAAKQAEAQHERDTFQRKNEEIDQQRIALLNQALEEAKSERMRLLDVARQEADYLSARRLEALRNEQEALSETFTRRTSEEVFSIARKTLADLAGITLEERMTDVFLRRLHELNDAQMAELKTAFQATSAPLLVRSAYPLPTAQSVAIEAALKEILGSMKLVKFETAPNIVCGIELSSEGHKLAWSISEYLAGMGKSIDALLKAQPKVQGESGKHSNG